MIIGTCIIVSGVALFAYMTWSLRRDYNRIEAELNKLLALREWYTRQEMRNRARGVLDGIVNHNTNVVNNMLTQYRKISVDSLYSGKQISNVLKFKRKVIPIRPKNVTTGGNK